MPQYWLPANYGQHLPLYRSCWESVRRKLPRPRSRAVHNAVRRVGSFLRGYPRDARIDKVDGGDLLPGSDFRATMQASLQQGRGKRAGIDAAFLNSNRSTFGSGDLRLNLSKLRSR